MKNNTEKNPYQTYGYTVKVTNNKKEEIKPSSISGKDLRVGGKK